MFELQTVRWPISLARFSDGRSIDISVAMMDIVTSSSINVKAFRPIRRDVFCCCLLIFLSLLLEERRWLSNKLYSHIFYYTFYLIPNQHKLGLFGFVLGLFWHFIGFNWV